MANLYSFVVTSNPSEGRRDDLFLVVQESLQRANDMEHNQGDDPYKGKTESEVDDMVREALSGIGLSDEDIADIFDPDRVEELTLPDGSSEAEMETWIEAIMDARFASAAAMMESIADDNGQLKPGIAEALDIRYYNSPPPSPATLSYFRQYCERKGILYDESRATLAFVSMSACPDEFLKLKDLTLEDDPTPLLQKIARPTRGRGNSAYVRIPRNRMTPERYGPCFAKLANSPAYRGVKVVREAHRILEGETAGIFTVYPGETVRLHENRERDDVGTAIGRQLLKSGRQFHDYLIAFTYPYSYNYRRLILAIYAYEHSQLLKLKPSSNKTETSRNIDAILEHWHLIGFGNKTADLWVNDMQEQILICFTENFNLNLTLGGTFIFSAVDPEAMERLEKSKDAWQAIGRVGSTPSLAKGGLDALMMDLYFTYAARALNIPPPPLQIASLDVLDLFPNLQSNDPILNVPTDSYIHKMPSQFPSMSSKDETALEEYSKKKPVLVSLGREAIAGMIRYFREHVDDEAALLQIQKAGDVTNFEMPDGRVVTLAYCYHPAYLRRNRDLARIKHFALCFGKVWEIAQKAIVQDASIKE